MPRALSPSRLSHLQALGGPHKRPHFSSAVVSVSPRCRLTSNIRVRCVSKSVGGGKFYLVKGTVCDVLTPHECVVQFDGGKIVEGVLDRQLETVVPKGSGRIAVVGGRLKGQRGKMVAKVDGGEAASVQLTSDFSMHTLQLDLIAEYVGPLDEYD